MISLFRLQCRAERRVRLTVASLLAIDKRTQSAQVVCSERRAAAGTPRLSGIARSRRLLGFVLSHSELLAEAQVDKYTAAFTG
jgi:hypothetical protein